MHEYIAYMYAQQCLILTRPEEGFQIKYLETKNLIKTALGSEMRGKGEGTEM